MASNDTAAADFHNSPGYHGYIEIQLNSTLIALSTIFYALRMYTRTFMTKSVGWDDAVAGFAYVVIVVQSALDLRAVQFGSGAHIEFVPLPLLAKFFESLTIQTLLYFWGVAIVRLSILAFLPRLGLDRTTKRAAWGLGFLVLAQAIVAFFYRLTECPNISDIFLPPFLPELAAACRPKKAENDLMLGHGIVGIVLDTALLILPIYIIYTKMIWSRRTIQVILVMSVGLFVMVTGIVRAVLIETLDFQADVTYEMANLGVWSNLEGHVGFWCGCFPALQPILRLVSYKLGLRSQLRSTGRSAGTSQRQYAKGTITSAAMASANRKPSSNGYLRNGSGVDEFDNDSDSQRAFASAKDIELGQMQRSNAGGNIYKTTDVKVVYEDAVDKRSGSPKSWINLER